MHACTLAAHPQPAKAPVLLNKAREADRVGAQVCVAPAQAVPLAGGGAGCGGKALAGGRCGALEPAVKVDGHQVCIRAGILDLGR
jgi:hypothetical protein